ncbi:hypothetical protein NZK35_12545 [Stieleria sp. ICT_E10.1]|nr:hypothetical protein [Stieleria sedimenti]
MDITTNAKLSANIEAIKTQIMVSPSSNSWFADAVCNHCIFHAKQGAESGGREPLPNAIYFDAKRGGVVSGRARALRSFTVFLKRDRTARGLSV